MPLPPEGAQGREGEPGRRCPGHLSVLVSAAPLQPCPARPRQASWFPGSPSARPLTLTHAPGLTGPASVPGGLQPDGQWLTPQFSVYEVGAQCGVVSLGGREPSVHLSVTAPSCLVAGCVVCVQKVLLLLLYGLQLCSVFPEHNHMSVLDRKSTRLNSSHRIASRMPSSA